MLEIFLFSKTKNIRETPEVQEEEADMFKLLINWLPTGDVAAAASWQWEKLRLLSVPARTHTTVQGTALQGAEFLGPL